MVMWRPVWVTNGPACKSPPSTCVPWDRQVGPVLQIHPLHQTMTPAASAFTVGLLWAKPATTRTPIPCASSSPPHTRHWHVGSGHQRLLPPSTIGCWDPNSALHRNKPESLGGLLALVLNFLSIYRRRSAPSSPHLLSLSRALLFPYFAINQREELRASHRCIEGFQPRWNLGLHQHFGRTGESVDLVGNHRARSCSYWRKELQHDVSWGRASPQPWTSVIPSPTCSL